MSPNNKWTNKLYFGDNLSVLRTHVPENCADLIYLDPPFNSKADYNVLYKEKDGTAPKSQIAVFKDTWHWNIESEEVYRQVVLDGPAPVATFLKNLREFLSRNDMMAYLVMMAIRLVELHRVLKPTGSIFLHCDPTASHYLKLLMDATFGTKNFRNEIIWCRSTPKAHITRRFPNGHDVILFYTKSSEAKFNMIYMPHKEEYVESHYTQVDLDTGRRYQLTSLINPNPNRPNLTYEFPPGSGIVKVWRWTEDRMMKAWNDGKVIVPEKGGIAREKRYLDEQTGTSCTTVWHDIPPINAQAKERLHFPTQKPEALLRRILEAGSSEGDLVLDPFCGCGTTVAAAESLNRRWIGIDITHLAISLMRHRLQNTYADDLSPYEVIGEPKDLESAKALIEDRQLHSRYQFEWWALSLVGARPARDKHVGADRGVDGYIFFFDDKSNTAKKIVVQVKSGKVGPAQVRDLIGVIAREEAMIGLFLTLNPATDEMQREASAARFYEPEYLGDEHKVPKCQILTIQELLEGTKKARYPRLSIATHDKAPRQYKEKAPTQDNLL